MSKNTILEALKKCFFEIPKIYLINQVGFEANFSLQYEGFNFPGFVKNNLPEKLDFQKKLYFYLLNKFGIQDTPALRRFLLDIAHAWRFFHNFRNNEKITKLYSDFVERNIYSYSKALELEPETKLISLPTVARCKSCNKQLNDAISIRRGYGPECAEKHLNTRYQMSFWELVG